MASQEEKEVIKTVAELAEHITWLYAKVEDLTNRVADLEGWDTPPWEEQEGVIKEDDLEGT